MTDAAKVKGDQYAFAGYLSNGINLREYLAGQALAGCSENVGPVEAAKWSVLAADALLEELSR